MATTGGSKVNKMMQVQESKDVNVSNHEDAMKIFHVSLVMLNLYYSLHSVQQMQFIPLLVQLAFKIIMDYEH